MPISTLISTTTDSSHGSLSPVLISRFMLNLRQAGQPTSTFSSDMNLSRFSMPAFAIPESRIIGNLGEDLHSFAWDAADHEGEEDADPDKTQ